MYCATEGKVVEWKKDETQSDTDRKFWKCGSCGHGMIEYE